MYRAIDEVESLAKQVIQVIDIQSVRRIEVNRSLRRDLVMDAMRVNFAIARPRSSSNRFVVIYITITRECHEYEFYRDVYAYVRHRVYVNFGSIAAHINVESAEITGDCCWIKMSRKISVFVFDRRYVIACEVEISRDNIASSCVVFFIVIIIWINKCVSRVSKKKLSQSSEFQALWLLLFNALRVNYTRIISSTWIIDFP